MGTGDKKRNTRKKGSESVEKKGDVKAVLYIAIGILFGIFHLYRFSRRFISNI